MTTRCLVAIPAYNEEATIAAVVRKVRAELPGIDLLVVDDGSGDGTAAVLRDLGVRIAWHRCNLGYGRAMQTAVACAEREGYEALVTLDADGQHDPAQVRPMLAALQEGTCDVLVGSRYVASRRYDGAPLGRRMGMLATSLLVHALAGHRVYDTTSGFKAMRRSVFRPLLRWHFVDFHAEALVYLLRLGFRVAEHAVTVAERRHGQSMYSLASAVEYPAKTFLMAFLGMVEAEVARRGARQ